MSAEVKTKTIHIKTRAGKEYTIVIEKRGGSGFGEIDWDTDCCYICDKTGVALHDYHHGEAWVEACADCLLATVAQKCPTCNSYVSAMICPDEKCQGYVWTAALERSFQVGKCMRQFVTGDHVYDSEDSLPEYDTKFSDAIGLKNWEMHYAGTKATEGTKALFSALFSIVPTSKHTKLVTWDGLRPTVREFGIHNDMYNTVMALSPRLDKQDAITVCWMMDELALLGLKERYKPSLMEAFIKYIVKSKLIAVEINYCAVTQVNMCRRIAADVAASSM